MQCNNCGTNVDGMKFCGNCGTKVGPPHCWQCNVELLTTAKFCMECGAPVKKPQQQPAEVAQPASVPEVAQPAPAPEVAEPAASLEVVEPAASPEVVEPAVDEAQVEASPPPSTPEKPAEPAAEDGEMVTPTIISTATPGASPAGTPGSDGKKQFSVKESPKCQVCGKTVYKKEESLDSQGMVFHKDCHRCKTCKVYLTGRERIMEPESGASVKVANGMYLVAREGSHLGNKGDFFCDKHSVKARGEVVKGQSIEEKYRDDEELKRVASMRKEQNEEARMSMQVRVGDMIPTCAKCGFPIDYGQKAITSGIEKIHEGCPSLEESNRAIRPARWFVRKAPERAAGTLTCDSKTKHPHTFLFELDKQTLMDCLKKNAYESAKLVYHPDETAHTSASKKLVVPSSDAVRAFDFNIKDYMTFTFADPRKPGKVQTPVLDKAAKRLVVTKFCYTNCVLQTMEAIFQYDEAKNLCHAEQINLSFEMWPAEAAAQMSAQLDPLADLKQQRAD